ncbi:hypothetical protein SDC9_155077 [bioreactor metagenome]|uniref:Uncharacterized protein n=1 Tax=bioreactor metagenome TaxID=1076179 RepID=A0A645F0H4_9ZZZZ
MQVFYKLCENFKKTIAIFLKLWYKKVVDK